MSTTHKNSSQSTPQPESDAQENYTDTSQDISKVHSEHQSIDWNDPNVESPDPIPVGVEWGAKDSSVSRIVENPQTPEEFYSGAGDEISEEKAKAIIASSTPKENVGWKDKQKMAGAVVSESCHLDPELAKTAHEIGQIADDGNRSLKEKREHIHESCEMTSLPSNMKTGVHCHIDPELTKTAQEIYEIAKDNQQRIGPSKFDMHAKIKEQKKEINKMDEVKEKLEATGDIQNPKKIGAVGRERPSKDNSFSEANAEDKERKESLKQVEPESNTSFLLEPNVMAEIKKAAKKNPLTKELIEEAKVYTTVERENIRKQFNDVVAFYNISDNKAFYYITSAEARLAMDYIKRVRNGYITEVQNSEEQDKMVLRFMMKMRDLDLRADPYQIDNENCKNIEEIMQKDLDWICGIDLNDVGDKDSRHFVPSLIDENLFVTMPRNRRIEDLEARKKEDEEREKTEFLLYNWFDPSRARDASQSLDLAWFNRLWTIFESQNMTVDVVLMNATSIAAVRNWGHSCFYENSKREFMERKCFGEINNSDIYLCNQLENNQIVLGSFNLKPHGVFVNAVMSNPYMYKPE